MTYHHELRLFFWSNNLSFSSIDNIFLQLIIYHTYKLHTGEVTGEECKIQVQKCFGRVMSPNYRIDVSFLATAFADLIGYEALDDTHFKRHSQRHSQHHHHAD